MGKKLLGPFLIDEVLGKGGMALVWRARHRGDGTPVALKVLLPEVAAQPTFAEAFRYEVTSAARLDHPRITAVYDHGQVTPAEAGGELPSGAPWLAMELVDGTSAGPLRGRLPWRGLRGILLGVLDGLAHAHARGVVHRDIKPGNVLIDRADRRVKLTDFGLAHSIRGDETGPTDEDFHGTPEYMAPEQIECRWRDFGPWTDLYAVGAMAWTLACGTPPYEGELKDVLYGHMAGYLPEFTPAQPVPEGFAGWIQTLMATKPRNRFQRAADASWALVHLGEPEEESTLDPESTGNFYTIDPDAPREPSTKSPKSKRRWWKFGRDKEDEDETFEVVAGSDRPPMPKSWKGQRVARKHLHGAGLALFGQRAHGLVGRVAERNQLWSALRSAHSDLSPHLVVVDGATGTGKSALVGWFAERAEELGAAQVLSATHTETGGPNDGLAPMLATHLRVGGMDRAGAIERTTKALARVGHDDPNEAVALTELAIPSMAEERTVTGLGATFSGPTERHALLARYLAALASDRPLILWLDDLHLGLDSMGFVEYLLRSDHEAPILVVGAVRTEALAAEPARAERVDSLLALPGAERMTLAPLDREEASALVRELLGLEPDLAAQVESRSGGNPLFAVQLVGDWVARDLLESGDRGFRLVPGADASLPKSLLEVWEGRLEQLLEGRSEPEIDALELAAVLGQTVDPYEWRDACYLAEVGLPHSLVDDLLRLRLAVRTDVPGGWAFVHGMLREALERQADRGGRHALWASIAADALERRPEEIVRRARLLLAANRTEETPEPLSQAVLAELRQGEFARAGEMQELYMAALDRLGVPYDDQRRIFGDVLAARVLRRTGDIQQAYAIASDALERARRQKDPQTLVEALSTTGSTAVAVGKPELALQLLREGIEVATDKQLPAKAAAMAVNLAFVHMRQGAHYEGMEAARDAILKAEAAGAPHTVASGYSQLARCTWQAGDLDKAEFLLAEARIRHERMGSRWGLASTTNTLGELRRARGDFKGAEAAYREAAERYDACGSGDAVFARMNVAVTLLERSQPKRALKQLDEVAGELRSSGRAGMTAAVHALRLLPLAALRRWDDYDREVQAAEVWLSQTGVVDIDIARFTKRAGDACLAADEIDRGRRALNLARDQWTAMGRLDVAEEVEETLLVMTV